MFGGGRLLNFSRALRSSVGPTNWHNLGKFASGGNSQQESHWNSLKGFDSNVSNLVESVRENPELLDWSHWENRISHRNILAHMKKTYTNTIKCLDDALTQDKSADFLHRGWESYEEVRKTCSDATKSANKIINDGIKALWISQHNPPTWKVDTNEWLESDEYWQAFVEKHAMYSQSGSSNDPESPTEIEVILRFVSFQAVKAKWNSNMFKFNERTDTPMLYDYMHHNPSWEFYDVNRRQFFEHLEYFLLRTGEDFRNFPDIPRWKWLTHIEDLRFKRFSVEMRRKFHRQMERVSRFERLDLGPGEHESEEDFHFQVLLEDKANCELVLSDLLAGFGFLVDPLVPVENLFQLNYLLSRDEFHSHKSTKLYSLGPDLPYLYALPHHSTAAKDNPMNCFYNLLDYLTLSSVKTNPTYSTRLQLQCQVLHERGPNWLKLPNEKSYEAFLRRLRYDDPLRPVFEGYVTELKERLKGAKEVPQSEWFENFERLRAVQREKAELLSKERGDFGQVENFDEMVKNGELLVKDMEG